MTFTVEKDVMVAMHDGVELATDCACRKPSSTSCDQAVFVDQATGVSLPSDAVPVEIDRFG
jgi:hypothetical protein